MKWEKVFWEEGKSFLVPPAVISRVDAHGCMCCKNSVESGSQLSLRLERQ